MLIGQSLWRWLAFCALGTIAADERAGQHWVTNGGNTVKTSENSLSEVVVQPGADLLHLSLHRKRQTPAVTPQALKNNVPSNRTIVAGDSHFWVLPASELASIVPTPTPYVPDLEDGIASDRDTAFRRELKRQTERFIYVTLDICDQPAAAGGLASTAPPGLTLWISQSQDNQNPGPGYRGSGQTAPINTDHGHADYGDPEQGDTYIGVSAPSLDGFNGGWTYRIAVSTAAPYTVANSSATPHLRFVDSDPSSSLMVTDLFANDTDQWMQTGGPFSLFVYNASDPMANAVNRSYCGLANYATGIVNVAGKSTKDVQTGMKLTTNGSYPYQQFYVPQLQPNASYRATLGLLSRYTRDSNTNTPNGGGTLWPSVDFPTRLTDNCKLIFNLSFCEDVAYSVPTNGGMSLDALSFFYDNVVYQDLWMPFAYSLAQIPCDTQPDAKYSLARNCDDCSNAYRNWLCAVSIPRCGDFLSPAEYLPIRNTNPFGNGTSQWPNGTAVNLADDLVNNNLTALGRNANGAQNGQNSTASTFLNSTGPYKEVLPCDGLCYDLVQSCPSALGFACPRRKQLAWGYGSSADAQTLPEVDSYPRCNHPGRLWGSDAASNARVSRGLLGTALMVLIFAMN